MPILSPQPQSPSQRHPPLRRLWRSPLLLLNALLLVLLPLIPADLSSLNGHGAKSLAFELGAALLLGLSPWFPRRVLSADSGKRNLGPLAFLAALALWAFASFVISPNPAFAFNAWWLIGGGLVISYTIVAQTDSDRRFLFVLDALTAASAIIAVCCFAFYQSAGMKVAEGTYHDHQLLGAALMILLPMALTALILPGSLGRKLVAMAAFVMGGFGLLFAQDRSAWIGETAALLVFGTSFLWVSLPTWKSQRNSQKLRPQVRQQIIVYGILIAIAFGYFFVAVPQTDLLKGRVQTLFTTVLAGRDDSLEWRLDTWQGTWEMFRAKPWTGWGVGSYPVYEQLYTGHGDSTATVIASAARIGDETHNSYLQLAAELGVLGAALWILTLGAAFWKGFRALPRLTHTPVRQRVLMGGLSALAGQVVDALANPAWQFGEITIYLWVILGLVVSASEASDSTQAALRQTPQFATQFFQCSLSAFSLWVALRLIADAHALPIPSL